MTTNTEETTIEKIKEKAAQTLSDFSDHVGKMMEPKSGEPETRIDTEDDLLKEAASHVFRVLHNFQSYLKFEPLDDVQLQSAVDSTREMIERHIGDLSGEYRVIQNVLTEQDDTFAGGVAKTRGAVEGFVGQWQNDLAFLKELISRSNEMVTDYAQLHALTLSYDKELATGMAWSHMRDWQINRNDLMVILYERTITQNCTGKPYAPVVEKGLDEWIQSSESALNTSTKSETDSAH